MTRYESLLTTHGPMPAGLVIWRPSAERWAITVCVKATCALAEEDAWVAQQEPLSGDCYWDEGASLRWPSDFAPRKPRVDVLLSGHAYPAPHTAPTELIARLRVGAWSKAVRVHGDRHFRRAADGSVHVAQEPIVQVPLRYERAPKDAWNPIGFDPEQTFSEDAASPEAANEAGVFAGLAAPNLESIGGGAAGFSPLAIGWRADLLRVTDEAARWAQRFCVAPEPDERVLLVEEPAPSGFDFAIFNAAPPEMQLDGVELGAPLLLEHLHRSIARLRARLPRFTPRVSRGASLLPMRCDTIALDVDQRRMMLTFRATVEVRDVAAEHFTVLPASVSMQQTDPSAADTEEPTSPLPVPMRSPLLLTQELNPQSIAPALPFELQRLLDQTYAGLAAVPGAALPFESNASSLVPLKSPTLAHEPVPPPPQQPPPRVVPEVPSVPSAAEAQEEGAFPVQRYATLVAALEAEPTRRAFVFRTHKTTPSAHARLEHRFARELAEQKARGEDTLRRAYDAAYATAKRRPIDELTVSDYAFVVVSVERGEIDRALASLGVDLAQLMRIQKLWRQRVASDRALAIEVERALSEERRRR